MFLTSHLKNDGDDKCIESTFVEVYISNSENSTVYDPYIPRLAKMFDRFSQSSIADVILWDTIIVALNSNEEIFHRAMAWTVDSGSVNDHAICMLRSIR